MILNAPGSTTQDIVSGLQTIASWLASWVVPLTAVGTLSMAVLQTAKNLFPLRRRFQRKRIREFLADSINELPSKVFVRVMELEYHLDQLTPAHTHSVVLAEKTEASATGAIRLEPHLDRLKSAHPRSGSMAETTEASAASETPEERIESRRAELDLISLVAAGDENAFYDLPIDDLAAQVKGVGSVILDYSRLHSTLLVCLATKANPSDLLLVLDPPSHDPLYDESDEQKFEDKQFIKKYAAAKSRIATQLRCSIESMQTSIAFQWKRALQLASFVLSFIFGVSAVGLGSTFKDHVVKIIASLAIGVVAGFIAPVARDLVAGIEKLNP
jgi:hypothetical protein